jgi:hypothetical protein
VLRQEVIGKMKSFAKILAVGAGILGIVGSASAVPTLYLSDGLVSVTVADGDPMDANPLAGVVMYNGPVGANWTLNVTTGLSKPLLGSPEQPWMDLNSVNATSRGAGNLTIKLSDDNFGPTGGQLVNTVGGTTVGRVSVNTFADAGNGIFSTTTPLTSQNDFGSGGFNSSVLTALNLTGPYSLTEVATITHAKRGVTSFSEDLRVPDSGLTLALLGSGLVGLATYSRSRKIA